MKYDSIIFDLDGTLWNSLDISAAAWTKGFQSLGINTVVRASDLKKIVGEPFINCLDILFPGIAGQYPGIIEKISYYEKDLVEKNGGMIYDNVSEGITILAKLYKIFIISNCEDWYLEAFLKHSKLRSAITDFDCFGKSKLSKAEMIRNIIIKHNLLKPICIGDTISDLEASKEAHAGFIFAGYGYGKWNGNCRKVSSFKELISLLS